MKRALIFASLGWILWFATAIWVSYKRQLPDAPQIAMADYHPAGADEHVAWRLYTVCTINRVKNVPVVKSDREA